MGLQRIPHRSQEWVPLSGRRLSTGAPFLRLNGSIPANLSSIRNGSSFPPKQGEEFSLSSAPEEGEVGRAALAEGAWWVGRPRRASWDAIIGLALWVWSATTRKSEQVCSVAGALIVTESCLLPFKGERLARSTGAVNWVTEQSFVHLNGSKLNMFCNQS